MQNGKDNLASPACTDSKLSPDKAMLLGIAVWMCMLARMYMSNSTIKQQHSYSTYQASLGLSMCGMQVAKMLNSCVMLHHRPVNLLMILLMMCLSVVAPLGTRQRRLLRL